MARILFIGGPGNISRSTIEALVSQGHEIASIRKNPGPRRDDPPITFFEGDRDTSDILKTSLETFRPETVVDTCCFTPEQAGQSVDIFSDKVAKYVFISTCDVYGYPLTRLPMRELDPWVPTKSLYAENKRICEEVFSQASQCGNFPLVIVRPSYSFGPPFVLNAFSRSGGLELISRLKHDQPVVIPGDGRTMIHPSSAHNTGLMLMEIVLSNGVLGESFTLGHNESTTIEGYYRIFAESLDVNPNFVYIPVEKLIPLEGTTIPDNLLSELTRFDISFSMEKFTRFFPQFTWEMTLGDAAKKYIEWHEAKGDIPGKNTTYEDDIIRLYGTLGIG